MSRIASKCQGAKSVGDGPIWWHCPQCRVRGDHVTLPHRLRIRIRNSEVLRELLNPPSQLDAMAFMFSTRFFTPRSLFVSPKSCSRRLSSAGTMFGDNCPLVLTPAQLHSIIAQPLKPGQRDPTSKFVILDASWHMPNSPRKAREEFLARHIPSARFLDVDEVASIHPLSLPHMMPDVDTFAAFCGETIRVSVLLPSQYFC